jgi:hypothetical protein
LNWYITRNNTVVLLLYVNGKILMCKFSFSDISMIDSFCYSYQIWNNTIHLEPRATYTRNLRPKFPTRFHVNFLYVYARIGHGNTTNPKGIRCTRTAGTAARRALWDYIEYLYIYFAYKSEEIILQSTHSLFNFSTWNWHPSSAKEVVCISQFLKPT